jgi:hypothetical protein
MVKAFWEAEEGVVGSIRNQFGKRELKADPRKQRK